MAKENLRKFNLSNEVVDAVSDMGFEEYSPIQEQAIPYLLDGCDVIGQAQTGTGKTAAFGIPIVEMVNPNDKSIQALVLCPTRELCIQVSEEISKLAKYKRDVRVLPVYGGQPIERQIRGLKKGAQIIIGTPGRVIDHIRRKTLKTGNIGFFVLDEADEMFAMGFREDIELVLQDVPEERQSLFFSATMAKDILKFAKTYQKDPQIIKVVKKEMTVPRVDQFYYDLNSNIKTEVLSRVLDIYNPKLTVVFCNTKRMVDTLTGDLQGRGYFADGLHGDLKQKQRDAVMDKFRKGNIDILVATDVAARGIDIDDVDLVINYDMPQDNEYYVHRIGRTARAGREGTAISFVTNRDYGNLKDIQRYTKTTISRHPLPTLKDIRSKQNDILMEKLRKVIDEDNLEKEIEMIGMLESEDNNLKNIAAGLLKLYRKESHDNDHREIDSVDNDKKPKSRSRRNDRNDRNGRNDRNDRNGRGERNEKKGRKKSNEKRLYVNVGRRKGISERHILSAFCNDAGIKAKKVGNIDIYDRYTFVNLDKGEVDQALKKLNGSHIKGSKVLVEVAND